jgi:hypothetical protein
LCAPGGVTVKRIARLLQGIGGRKLLVRYVIALSDELPAPSYRLRRRMCKHATISGIDRMKALLPMELLKRGMLPNRHGRAVAIAGRRRS